MTIGGVFQGAVDFDPGAGTHSLVSGKPKLDHPMAGFVLQLNSAGAFRWADHFQVSQTFSYSQVKDLVVDSSGAITVTGVFKGNADLNPDKRAAFSVKSVNLSDGYFVRLSAMGKFAWAKTMDSTFVSAMTVDGDGAIYVTGSSNIDNPDPGFVARLNVSNGALEQVIAVARSSAGFAVDGAGQVYMAGSFSGADVDFDFNGDVCLLSAENDLPGMFVMKLRW